MKDSIKGGRPDLGYVVDELHFLEDMSPKDINALWESCMPKITDVNFPIVIITGTKGTEE